MTEADSRIMHLHAFDSAPDDLRHHLTHDHAVDVHDGMGMVTLHGHHHVAHPRSKRQPGPLAVSDIIQVMERAREYLLSEADDPAQGIDNRARALGLVEAVSIIIGGITLDDLLGR